jgi:hypothetical protein
MRLRDVSETLDAEVLQMIRELWHARLVRLMPTTCARSECRETVVTER